uniref:Uncharacterized protein n=1 Tax=Plectus sambesii TaxID=2011161 RepID=A0A914ULE2_9BILA
MPSTAMHQYGRSSDCALAFPTPRMRSATQLVVPGWTTTAGRWRLVVDGETGKRNQRGGSGRRLAGRLAGDIAGQCLGLCPRECIGGRRGRSPRRPVLAERVAVDLRPRERPLKPTAAARPRLCSPTCPVRPFLRKTAPIVG